MKEIAETLFFVAGAILAWFKVGTGVVGCLLLLAIMIAWNKKLNHKAPATG